MENNPTLQSFTDSTNLIRELNRQRAAGNELRLSAVLSLGCSHGDVKQVLLALIQIRNEEYVYTCIYSILLDAVYINKL